MIPLEMLWEAEEPRHALETRFGFSDGASACRWISATLAEHWDVRAASCERIVISDRNALAWVDTPSGRLVAKWSVARDRFPRLEELARLTRWLDAQGLPVSAPLPARDGRVQVEVDGVSVGVQRHVGGELLDVADSPQVAAAGAILARLQDALAAYPDADRVATPVDPSEPPRPLTVRITDWLESANHHLRASAGETLRALLADAPPDALPTQLGHWDFRSANILCAGGQVAAILDFEQLRRDHRVVELARSAIMLGTRYRNWGPVPTEVPARFLAGYQSVRPLTRAEAGWWHILLAWQAMLVVPPGDDPTGWGPSAQRHLDLLAAHAARSAGRGPVVLWPATCTTAVVQPS